MRTKWVLTWVARQRYVTEIREEESVQVKQEEIAQKCGGTACDMDKITDEFEKRRRSLSLSQGLGRYPLLYSRELECRAELTARLSHYS